MFAVITPALIMGSFAERIRFRTLVAFVLLWTTLVYDPIAHWVWGAGGWLRALGALDFAGGTVVHISAGFAGLAAIVVGRRHGALLTGVFAEKAINGAGNNGLLFGNPGLVGVQFLAVLVTVVYAFVMTYVLLRVLARLGLGLRVSRQEEIVGLDRAVHGEAGYRF
jgi:ammonium transporter, Amt family